MPVYAEICNEKLGTKGDMGIRKVDRLVTEEVNEGIRNGYVMKVEDIYDIPIDVLGITDDTIAELAKARVRLVIARILERMPLREMERAVEFIDEEIPSYWEAQKRFNELNC